MLSRSTISWLRALQQKKNRDAEKVFMVEGEKGVLDGLSAGLPCIGLYATGKFIKENELSIPPNLEVIEASPSDLERAGTFETNKAAIAIFQQYKQPENATPVAGANLYLDQVKDPGNLGTIVRLADWYGLLQVFLSPGCVDFYNPKTIAATMGSFAHVLPVKVTENWLAENMQSNTIGADMQGLNLHQFTFPKIFILVMGNESHGLSEEAQKQVKHTIAIPRFGHAESLNVAMATGIILDNWKRQQTT
jgi:TrmH family RNA methyltransferase